MEELEKRVKGQAAREQPVAVGHVHFVARLRAGGADRARHHLRPGFDVLLGVADDSRFSGRAAGGVDAHHAVHGNREHAEGIGVPQVFLGGKRKTRQVAQLLQLVGPDARSVEFLAVLRNVVVGVLELRLQAAQLQGLQLGDACLLDGLEWKTGHAPSVQINHRSRG